MYNEPTKEQLLNQRAYLMDILAEIADASICYESARKAQLAIDEIKNQ